METYDVGSMPFVGDRKKFSEGAVKLVSQSLEDCESVSEAAVNYFERKIVENFLDKLNAGIDVPNYPQFRDMTKMFLGMMSGIDKMEGGYFETGKLSLGNNRPDIPEVLAIRRNSGRIYEANGGSFKFKICVTGPYTLSSLFAYRDPQIYRRLGEMLSKIVEQNIFSNRYGKTELLAVDEPTFGLVDDSVIDMGSRGRENLLWAWEKICHTALEKGVQTCLHLHSTADELYWKVESLRVIESHVSDPLYSSSSIKKLIESNNKLLKASVSISNFDQLIRQHILSSTKRAVKNLNQRLGELWREIHDGKTNPEVFLESTKLMRKRLEEIVNKFGSERVPYAGPECGLRGFPTYECATKCLERVSKVVKLVNDNPQAS